MEFVGSEWKRVSQRSRLNSFTSRLALLSGAPSPTKSLPSSRAAAETDFPLAISLRRAGKCARSKSAYREPFVGPRRGFVPVPCSAIRSSPKGGNRGSRDGTPFSA